MRISELSRRTGVAAHQLRYYEAQGLLQPSRAPNGYREYAPGAVVAVAQIRRLLEAGLSTKEIAFVLPCASGPGPELVGCPELMEALRRRLDVLEGRIGALEASRRALTGLVDRAERSPVGELACSFA